MKKIMITLFLSLVVFGSVLRAQHPTTKTTTTTHTAKQLRFYYYPQANVYYDPVNRQYIYYDNNNNWTKVQTLPSTITVQGTPRVMVYSETPEVWQMNAEHKDKYKNYTGKYPKGKAEGYKGSNPNRAKGKAKHEY